jgi:hypothetical protein
VFYYPIIWWLAHAAVSPSTILSLMMMPTGEIMPIWDSMYFLPNQNAINAAYGELDRTYNFGFTLVTSPKSSLTATYDHSTIGASFQGNEKIPNPLDLPVSFGPDEVLWGFNTPPNLNVREDDVTLGWTWNYKKNTSFQFLAGYDEYEDLNNRLSRFEPYVNGVTPPSGSIYDTSLASFGFPMYPTMVSPDNGKVEYFTIQWNRSF